MCVSVCVSERACVRERVSVREYSLVLLQSSLLYLTGIFLRFSNSSELS